MKAELQAIKDVWEATPRDANLARSMSDDYVTANPSEFTGFEAKSIEQLCGAIDTFREAGMDEEVQRMEVWLLHRFESQNIGGTYQPQIRVIGGTE